MNFMAQLIWPGVLLCSLLTACSSGTQDNPVGDESVAIAQTGPARAWLDGAAQRPTPQTNYDVAPVGDMIAGLQRRLEQQPDDVKGWQLLAQSYAYTGDMTQARNAAERAVELGADETVMSTAIATAHTDRRPAGAQQ